MPHNLLCLFLFACFLFVPATANLHQKDKDIAGDNAKRYPYEVLPLLPSH
jgi:hypothetical protein